MIPIALLLILACCFPGHIFAEQKVSVEDRMIGSTFKTLAKTFIMFADMDKLKKSNIDKINHMSEDVFREKYARVYRMAKDLPAELQVSYGITGTMTKKQAIKTMAGLEKNKIYKNIDSIPDPIIAGKFKQYLAENRLQKQKNNLPEQIYILWNRMIGKINAGPPEDAVIFRKGSPAGPGEVPGKDGR